MCYNTYIVKTNEVNNLDRKKMIEIKCKGADTLPIDRILEFQGGLKELSKENEKKLRNSILKFGFIAPFFVWDDHGEWRLLDGHQRLKTLLKMREEGYDIPMLPVDYIEADSEEDAKRKLLHITSQYGEFTADGFENFTFGLDGFEDIRLTNDEFVFKTKEEEGVVEDDYEIPDEIETDIKIGDIFQIGEHRLMCGDATSMEDVERLMDGNFADMIFTDPPYGVSYKGTNNPDGREWEIIEGDKLRGDALYQLLYGSFQRLYAFSKESPAVYVWHASSTQMIFETALNDAGFEVKQQLIWNKGMVLGHSDYHWAHEPMFYCKKKGSSTQWYGPRSWKTILGERRKSFSNLNKEQLIRIIQNILDESTTWEIDREIIKNYKHPTQKPVPLAGRAITNSSKQDDIVLDLFLGSGSTMVAAHQLDRKCYGMEIDPKYCQVIIDRMKNLDGNIVVKKNGEVYE